MPTPQQESALRAYARRVREARRAHPAITEPGLAPEFQRLLTDLLPLLPAAPQLTVVAEFVNPGVGRPDLALARPSAPARAFVELKSLDKPSDGRRWRDPHDRRQFKRFGELAHWAVCNFHELRLYERADDVGAAVLVPLAALDPDRDDRAADRLLERHDPDPALRLLERLAQAAPPQARDAEELARILAYSARLVRGIVRDRLAELQEAGVENAPLQQVRRDFRDVLYAHPEAGGYSSSDFDELFSGAFAQTLAFGLLLVREATGRPVGRRAADDMPDEHPLMKTALGVLSMEPVARDIGAGFDVMLDTVNAGLEDPAILAVRANGRDPILYFYEDFLRTFDEQASRRFGVYYTPVEVVRFMVGALDRALRRDLRTDGLADRNVHILDPAAGTGTFLLGVADRLRRDLLRRGDPGQVAPALRGLARRMYGFELLVGAYAVAHYRLHHALSRPVAEDGDPIPLPRLGVYLTDTLAEPGAAAPAGALGFVTEGIQDERREANRIKTEQPILAIIGNPPYRRLEEGEVDSLVGRWMGRSTVPAERPEEQDGGLWDDLKEPVREAGWGNQLNTFPELSVAFWRWAIWKLFEAPEAPRRGVVALITNRKFLTGRPYAGLRKSLREHFDRIEIVDLRGDARRGERADIATDQGVFDIQVGTAITLAVADGSKAKGALAQITYNDSWTHAHLSRRAKLDWLAAGERRGVLAGDVEVQRGLLDDMRPEPFMNGELLSLPEAFSFRRSGLQTKRDEFSYAFSEEELSRRIRTFVAARRKDAAKQFHNSRDRSWDQAKAIPFSKRHMVEVDYRPLDRRQLYNHRAYGDFLRPELQGVWGVENVGLYAMPTGTSDGPAVWCHGLLPDYHVFRGSYGGYAFPLYDRRAGYGPYNLRPQLVAALNETYSAQGAPVTPEDVFHAILALLSASTYTTRFAEDLEDVFPHVPFPRSRADFRRAARLGARIRAVETFARPTLRRYARRIVRSETAPTGPLRPIDPGDWDAGAVTLCADGSGRITAIPERVWRFAVSGYLVLPRWLAAREGRSLADDETFIDDLRDVAARIAELLDLFALADTLLARTLDAPLSREALELRDEEPDPADDAAD